jgi:diguanylate cyclase (GGDEF)-like protein
LHKRSDGTVFKALVEANPLFDEEGRVSGALVTVSDVTGRRLRSVADVPDIDDRGQLEPAEDFSTDSGHAVVVDRRHSNRSIRDEVTGLPNRILLQDRMTHCIARIRRTRSTMAVIFVVLDRFDAINQTVGSAAGDQILRGVAVRLCEQIRDADTVARFGGDEFVIVCEDVDERGGLSGITARIMTCFAEPYIVDGREHSITASCGVALGGGGAVLETLLGNARAAVDRSRGVDRGHDQHSEGERARAEIRVNARNALRRAAGGDDLSLVYQPVINLSTAEITGAEALLRWNHPARGIVGPVDFIPLAEDTGLIVSIGSWALKQASKQLVAWRRHRGPMDLTMAVNVSVRQLRSAELLETVHDVVSSGVDPSWLTLELTESMLLEDPVHTISALTELRAAGVHLAIDDFGTGYSSLSYLKRLPTDVLKIDRSFVRGLPHDEHDVAIIMAVLAVAKALNLHVIAEGVETTRQADTLRNLGCSYAQGYLFSPPISASRFEALLA